MKIQLGPRCLDTIRWNALILLITITCEIKAVDINSTLSLKPKLEFNIVSDTWKNVSESVNSTSKYTKYSFYDDFGGDFFVTCTCAQPIQWKFSGTLSPPDFVNVTPIQKDIHNSTFTIKLLIFFLAAAKFPNLAYSANISCQEVHNSDNQQQFSIFVKGNNGPFIVPENPPVLENDQANVIPCPTTDPVTSPTLLYYKDTNNSDILLKDVIYNPTKGFTRQANKELSFNPGNYTCRHGSHSFPVTVAGSSATNKYFPVANSVRTLSDDYLEFHCSSLAKPVTIKYDDKNNVTKLVYTKEEAKDKRVKLTVIGGQLPFRIDSQKGTISCTTEDVNEVIKSWTWEFIETPKLYIDNYKSEIHCLTPHTTGTILQTVGCHNKMHCDLMRRCLKNQTLCNLRNQNQFYTSRKIRCWIREQGIGFPCLNLPFYHMNGLVKCGLFGLEKTWEFFISLDNRRYIDWRDAPVKELVKIEEIDPVDYPIIQSTYFKCSAVAYLFADSLYFEIHYRNGSHIVSKGEEVKDTTVPPLVNIVDFNVVAILKKDDVSEDAIKINCFAPFWNTTQVLQATKFLN